jgi:hypothetical protein
VGRSVKDIGLLPRLHPASDLKLSVLERAEIFACPLLRQWSVECGDVAAAITVEPLDDPVVAPRNRGERSLHRSSRRCSGEPSERRGTDLTRLPPRFPQRFWVGFPVVAAALVASVEGGFGSRDIRLILLQPHLGGSRANATGR